MRKPVKDPTLRTDLGIPAVRRHFADALPAVVRILDLWGLSRADQDALLGLSLLSLRRHLQGETLELNEAQVTRMSLICGIYQALHRAFPAETADDWFTRRNDLPPCLGHTPLAYALRHGLTGLFTIRKELEAAAHSTVPTTPEDRRRASLLPQPDFDLGARLRSVWHPSPRSMMHCRARTVTQVAVNAASLSARVSTLL